MWLKKRGKFWHYRFNIAGQDFSGSTRSTDYATAKLVMEDARRQAVLFGIGKAAAPSLGSVIDAWMGCHVEGSHKRAGRQSREALKPLLGVALDRLTSGRVLEWRAEYLQDHSAASANLVLRYLKLWTNYALRERLIREFPWEVKPVKAQERKRPTVEDPRAWLDKVTTRGRNPQVRAALALTMMAGLRESELLQARWEWLHDGVLTVQGRTKSRKVRAIPLPPWCMQELAAYAGGDIPKLGLMFPGEKGKPHRQGWLRPALKRGGIGMHRLRATFATLLLRSKVNPKDVQEMLGHRDIRTTMIYSEGSMDEKRKAQEALWA